MVGTHVSQRTVTNSRTWWTCSHSLPRTRLSLTFLRSPLASHKTRGADAWAFFASDSFSSKSQAEKSSGVGGTFGPDILRLQSVTEHLTFFREHRDFLSPEDLCLLMEGLWPCAIREHTPKSSSRADSGVAGEEVASASRRVVESAQKSLFNTSAFLHMMNDTVRRLRNFTPTELPRVFAALHNMRWRDRNLFKIVEPMTIRYIPQLAVLDLPKVIQSYVSAKCGSPLLYDTLFQRCMQSGREFGCKDLATLAEASSKSPYKGKTSLMALDPLIVENIHQFTPEELTRIAQAYTERIRDRRDASAELALEFALVLQSEGGELLKRLTPEQLVTILQALALWSKLRPHLRGPFTKVFNIAVEPLLERHQELRPITAATCVWAYCRINANSGHIPLVEKLLEVLHEDLLPVIDKLPGSSLASCLLSFAKHGSRRPENRPGVPAADLQPPMGARFVEAAEDSVKKITESLPARELTSAVLAYSLLRIGSTDLYAVLQQGCMQKCHELPMEQAASILWSFATVRMGNTFFREVQIDILERLNQLSVHAVCDVLWAYCVVRHYDAHFFKTLLATLVPSRLADDSRCALLYPAILDIQRHFPDMDPEGLDRYSTYVSDAFRSQQLQFAPQPSELESVVETLQHLSMRPKVLANVDGYVVDVLVDGESDDVRPVAILYHSALPAPAGTLHLTTGDPLGETMLRQRYLRGCGYSIVNLLDRSWKELNSEQRLKFLMTKISQARQAKQPSASQHRAST